MKKVLYVLIALLLLYLILALFGKSEQTVVRTVSVNKPADLVRTKLSDLNYYHKWDPWGAQDPNLAPNFSGTPGQPGHKMDWKSPVKEVGQGTLEITAVKPDSIINKLSFEGRGDARAFYTINEKDGKTDVSWGIEMKFPFLMRPMTLFMNMDKMVGDKFDSGLQGFKKLVESEAETPQEANYDIKETEWPEANYVGTKKEMVSFDKMQPFFANSYPAIFKEMGMEKQNPEGAPAAIFYSFDEAKGQAEVAAVVKFAKGIKLKGCENHIIPASKALHLAYYGGYDKMMAPHNAIHKYMEGKGMKEELVIEEYATDPGKEPDTAKWLTNIYYILKK